MRATEFFKKVGIDAVKSYIAAYEDHLTDELKNLVNAYELVESFEDIEQAKEALSHCANGFNRVKVFNKDGSMSVFYADDLKKAIELVESVNE